MLLLLLLLPGHYRQRHRHHHHDYKKSQQRCSTDSGEVTGVREWEGRLRGKEFDAPICFQGHSWDMRNLGNPLGDNHLQPAY